MKRNLKQNLTKPLSLSLAVAMSAASVSSTTFNRYAFASAPTPAVDLSAFATTAVDSQLKSELERDIELLNFLEQLNAQIGDLHKQRWNQIDNHKITTGTVLAILGAFAQAGPIAMMIWDAVPLRLPFRFSRIQSPNQRNLTEGVQMTSSALGLLFGAVGTLLNSQDKGLSVRQSSLNQQLDSIDTALSNLTEMANQQNGLRQSDRSEVLSRIAELRKQKELLKSPLQLNQSGVMYQLAGTSLTVGAYFFAPHDHIRTGLMAFGTLLSVLGGLQHLKADSPKRSSAELYQSLTDLQGAILFASATLRAEIQRKQRR